MLDVRFMVKRTPVTKGNHAAFPFARGECDDCKSRWQSGYRCGRRNCFRGILVGTRVTDDKGSELDAWEQLVHVEAMSARNRAGQRMVEPPGAVEVSMIFVLARPDGHWDSRGNLTAAGRDRPLPTVKPDTDKLARATADGLTGALVKDDSQLVFFYPGKVYAPYRGATGVIIVARQVSGPPAWVTAELERFGVASPSAQRTLL